MFVNIIIFQCLYLVRVTMIFTLYMYVNCHFFIFQGHTAENQCQPDNLAIFLLSSSFVIY